MAPIGYEGLCGPLVSTESYRSKADMASSCAVSCPHHTSCGARLLIVGPHKFAACVRAVRRSARTRVPCHCFGIPVCNAAGISGPDCFFGAGPRCRDRSETGPVSRNALVYSTRAAASLAKYFLGRRDSVGLITYGDEVVSVDRDTGKKQLYVILTKLAGAMARGNIPLQVYVHRRNGCFQVCNFFERAKKSWAFFVFSAIR